MYKSKIIKNKIIAPEHYRIKLKLPVKNFKAEPGQFVMLKADDRLDPLLPRPFSICSVDDNSFEVIYKVVGKTTKILSGLKKGDSVNILGPLGNGFKLLSITDHREPILVGGGHGIAPLLFLANELKKIKKDISVLIGARSKDLVLCKDEFEKMGAVVKIATDDGSFGHKGLITGLLEKELKIDKNVSIYACGPNQMLKSVMEISKKYGVSSQISLENIMGCGIGVCLSCVCKGKDGKHKLTCSDGPVFNYKDIIL